MRMLDIPPPGRTSGQTEPHQPRPHLSPLPLSQAGGHWRPRHLGPGGHGGDPGDVIYTLGLDQEYLISQLCDTEIYKYIL